MKRAFYFSFAAAAVLGFTASAWAQAAGGAGGAGGSAGAGASGSAGAGASGSAGAGAAGTGGVGANAGTTGQAGAAGKAGANNGVGAANGLGANNGVNTNNNAVNTGVNSRSGFGNTGTSGRTNANAGGARSNLNPNAGESGTNAGGFRSNLNPNAGENGISQNPFFSNQAVRQQLRMNDTQFNSLNRAYQDAYTNYQNSLNGLGKNLTADQRNQQMEMLQNKFNDRFNQNVNSTLTDPGVRTRFEQLNRQYMGLSNFNNPAIQKQLNLTPQQLNQIRQLSTSIRSQESNANPSLNQSQLYSQTWDQLNSILTPQQQQTWSQLTGERFDFGALNGNRTGQSTIGAGASPGTGGTANGDRNPDPNNNLTAPRNNSGNVPLGTSPGTETNGTGTNAGNTSGTNGNSTTGGTGGTTGTSGSTSGTGSSAGTTTGSNSSSK